MKRLDGKSQILLVPFQSYSPDITYGKGSPVRTLPEPRRVWELVQISRVVIREAVRLCKGRQFENFGGSLLRSFNREGLQLR